MRATAVLGVPTPERLVYDNLDLLVHPLAVSFTDQQLNQLWVRPLSTPPVCILHDGLGTACPIPACLAPARLCLADRDTAL